MISATAVSVQAVRAPLAGTMPILAETLNLQNYDLRHSEGIRRDMCRFGRAA